MSRTIKPTYPYNSYEAVRVSAMRKSVGSDNDHMVWNVPLLINTKEKPATYKLLLSLTLSHVYDDKTLPAFIAERLGKIGAVSAGRMKDIAERYGTIPNAISNDAVYFRYGHIFPLEFELIGWRCSQDFFMLSLSDDEFDRVLGDAGVEG